MFERTPTGVHYLPDTSFIAHLTNDALSLFERTPTGIHYLPDTNFIAHPSLIILWTIPSLIILWTILGDGWFSFGMTIYFIVRHDKLNLKFLSIIL